MPTKHLAAIEEHVVAVVRKRLREQLPGVETVCKVTDDESPEIDFKVKLKPDSETGDYELIVTCKSKIPGRKEVVKARISDGQLQLI